MAWLSTEQIASMGFASCGGQVLISEKASFYNCANIHLGNNVRIDDFTVLSAGRGGIQIGNHIHIAVFTLLIGAEKITLQDFSNLSSRVAVYSSTDDFSGHAMTNPTVPYQFTNVKSEPVDIGRHVVIGSGSVVLPGVTLAEGVAVGALSLVRHHCESFGIYAGIPAKRIGERSRNLLTLEQQFIGTESGQR